MLFSFPPRSPYVSHYIKALTGHCHHSLHIGDTELLMCSLKLQQLTASADNSLIYILLIISFSLITCDHIHCTYTALLEKANVRGVPLIELFLLRLLNSSL